MLAHDEQGFLTGDRIELGQVITLLENINDALTGFRKSNAANSERVKNNPVITPNTTTTQNNPVVADSVINRMTVKKLEVKKPISEPKTRNNRSIAVDAPIAEPILNRNEIFVKDKPATGILKNILTHFTKSDSVYDKTKSQQTANKPAKENQGFFSFFKKQEAENLTDHEILNANLKESREINLDGDAQIDRLKAIDENLNGTLLGKVFSAIIGLTAFFILLPFAIGKFIGKSIKDKRAEKERNLALKQLSGIYKHTKITAGIWRHVVKIKNDVAAIRKHIGAGTSDELSNPNLDDDNGGSGFWGGLLGALLPFLLAGLVAAVGMAFSPIGAAILAAATVGFGNFTKSGQDFFKSIGESLSEKAFNSVEFIKTKWTETTGYLSKKWDDVVNSAKNFFTEKLVNPVKNTVKKGRDYLERNHAEAVNWTVDKAEKVADTVVNAKESLSNGYSKAKNYVKGKFTPLNSALGYEGGNLTGMTEAQSRAVMGDIQNTESTGKLDSDNKQGYFGQYQFGAEALIEAGLVKGDNLKSAKKASGKDWYKKRTRNGEMGGHEAFLRNPANWTVKGGLDAYLSDKALQDKSVSALANKNIQYGINSGALSKNSLPERVAGYVKAAHLVGAGKANKWFLKGIDSKDGNGTKASKYANDGANAIKYLAPKVEAVLSNPAKTQATSKTVNTPSDLKLKKAEAVAGGAAQQGTLDLAKAFQDKYGADLKYFSAFNDTYHQKNSPNSGHTKGLKFDAVLNDPKKAAEMKANIEALAAQAGVKVKVLNEYAKLSKKGTGGHLDVGFANNDDAAKFSDFYNKNIKPTTVAKTAQNTPVTTDILKSQTKIANSTVQNVSLPSVKVPVMPNFSELKIPAMPDIIEPITTASSHKTVNISSAFNDVGQNVSDRNIAHIITGGIGG